MFANDTIIGDMKYFYKNSFYEKHSKFLLVNQSINRGVKDSISSHFVGVNLVFYVCFYRTFDDRYNFCTSVSL